MVFFITGGLLATLKAGSMSDTESATDFVAWYVSVTRPEWVPVHPPRHNHNVLCILG